MRQFWGNTALWRSFASLRVSLRDLPPPGATILRPFDISKESNGAKRRGPLVPHRPPPPPQFKENKAISIQPALQKIHTQRHKLYAKLLIHNFPFTVTKTDLITTHRMKDVRVGDQIVLEEVREVGSPDYKLHGTPLLPKGAVRVRAVVMEHCLGVKQRARMRRQRKGRRPMRTIKPLATVLRITDIEVDPNFSN